MNSNLSDRNLIDIDRTALDRELCRHPGDLLRASEVRTLLDDRMQNLKQDLVEEKRKHELLQAQLQLEYRLTFEDSGRKVTETAIQSYIISDPRYQTSQAMYSRLERDILAANTELSKSENELNALKIKGHMLRDLTALYTANYFSTDAR